MCYKLRETQTIIPAFEPCEHGYAHVFEETHQKLIAKTTCMICNKKWVA